jgi:hypothetical protein
VVSIITLPVGLLAPPAVVRVYIVSVSVAVVIGTVYRTFLWRWRFVRWWTGKPLVDGTWRGTLLSSYVDIEDGETSPIPVALLVTQNVSTFVVTLMTAESTSVSRGAELVRLADRRWSLTWHYENVPRPSLRGHSERHRGLAEAMIGTANDAALFVEYFTDRLTAGEMRLDEWSPSRYGTHESAFQATNFHSPRPFARSEV